ncbi:MAG: ParA family protein [Myxococcota bacterium]
MSTPRRLAFINEKGGSCKTTLAVNTAAYLARELGERVLLVDVDPQGQAGKCVGLDVSNGQPTLADALLDPRAETLRALCRPTEISNLHVVVSNKRLADLPVQVASNPQRETLLRGVVDAVADGFDYVIFDAPPSLGLLSTSIMLAARELVVPVPLTFLAMDGCAEMLDSVDALRARTGHPVEVVLMVPTLYRPTRLADEILARLRGHFGSRVAQAVIGYSVKIDEAQSHGKTIWEYAPRSPGAYTLEGLAKELVRLGKRRGAGQRAGVRADA